MTYVQTEEFKPIPQRRRPTLLGTVLFHARSVLDLQALTIFRFIAPHLKAMHGPILDVGCGDMPYRALIPAGSEYKGIDVAQAADFDMTDDKSVTIFNGIDIPFESNTFKYVICTEVLEHAVDARALVAEIHRVLQPGGQLVMTMPFAARVHFAPHDYRRLTPYGIVQLLSAFRDVDVQARGDDIAVIANKLIVICMRMLRLDRYLPLRLLGLLCFGPLAVIFLVLAHSSLVLGWGSTMDPLGYGVTASK